MKRQQPEGRELVVEEVELMGFPVIGEWLFGGLVWS
jgi:hypothetical protein